GSAHPILSREVGSTEVRSMSAVAYCSPTRATAKVEEFHRQKARYFDMVSARLARRAAARGVRRTGRSLSQCRGAELNDRGVQTARGGKWSVRSVIDLCLDGRSGVESKGPRGMRPEHDPPLGVGSETSSAN